MRSLESFLKQRSMRRRIDAGVAGGRALQSTSDLMTAAMISETSAPSNAGFPVNIS
jgi:hypothetical protein